MRQKIIGHWDVVVDHLRFGESARIQDFVEIRQFDLSPLNSDSALVLRWHMSQVRCRDKQSVDSGSTPRVSVNQLGSTNQSLSLILQTRRRWCSKSARRPKDFGPPRS